MSKPFSTKDTGSGGRFESQVRAAVARGRSAGVASSKPYIPTGFTDRTAISSGRKNV